MAYTRAREIAGRAGDYNALLRAAISESDSLEGAGRHAEAAEVARRGIADAEAYGLARTSGAFLAINLAEPLISLGRWSEALQVVEHALETAPPLPYRASLQGLATDIALARGDLDRAESLLQSAWTVLARGNFRDQNTLPHHCREIELLLARDRGDEAFALVERILAEHDLTVTPRYAWPMLVASVRAAESLLPELRTLAGRIEADGGLQEAWSLTFAAEAARASGAPDRGAWEAAVAAWAALRQPYAEARALLGAARVTVAGGSARRRPDT